MYKNRHPMKQLKSLAIVILGGTDIGRFVSRQLNIGPTDAPIVAPRKEEQKRSMVEKEIARVHIVRQENHLLKPSLVETGATNNTYRFSASHYRGSKRTVNRGVRKLLRKKGF